MSGEENMAYDRETLARVEAGTLPPTLRFFTWSIPTVSYGRLQNRPDLSTRVPVDQPSIQRPTGGGIVYHDKDVCVSLCWRPGQSPMPGRSIDQYRYIHEAIQRALKDDAPLRLARCTDMSPTSGSFAVRECFTNPVGFDLLRDSLKVVGGAIARHRNAVLYQGSIHLPLDAPSTQRFKKAFALAFTLA